MKARKSMRELAVQALSQSGTEMTVRNLWQELIKLGYVSKGKTPELTLASILYMDVKNNPTQSTFVQTAPHTFKLRTTTVAPAAPVVVNKVIPVLPKPATQVGAELLLLEVYDDGQWAEVMWIVKGINAPIQSRYTLDNRRNFYARTKITPNQTFADPEKFWGNVYTHQGKIKVDPASLISVAKVEQLHKKFAPSSVGDR